MERRAHERLPSTLKARLFYGNLFYAGMVTNLSEKGVFIKSKMSFNVNSVFVLVMLVNNKTVNILARVRRCVKSNDHGNSLNDGMGIELLNPPVNYLEFVRDCKLSSDSIN